MSIVLTIVLIAFSVQGLVKFAVGFLVPYSTRINRIATYYRRDGRIISASPRCATFTPSSSAKSPRCSTAGITSRCPRREASKPAMLRSVSSQLGEHSAQFGAQVSTSGPVHRPGTVGQQQAQPRDTARAHRARTGQALHDLVDQTHRGCDG